MATRGTATAMEAFGLRPVHVNKVAEGRPHIVDRLVNGEIDMVINTTIGAQSIRDSFSIRRTTLQQRIPYFTTVNGAMAAAHAIEAARLGGAVLPPVSLQDHHRGASYTPEDAPSNRTSYRAADTGERA